MTRIHKIALAAALALGAPVALMAQGHTSSPQVITIKGPSVATATFGITGKVTDIDRAQRRVVVQGNDGRTATLRVGPNVANFDTIELGDEVTMRYREALALAIAKGGAGSEAKLGEIRTKVQADAARPLPGEEPGMAAMERTTLVANVFKIDRDRDIVTLRGTDGVPVEIKVPDPNVLKQLKLDDQVIIGYRQAAVVSIEPGANATAKSGAGGADTTSGSGAAASSDTTSGSSSATSQSSAGAASEAGNTASPSTTSPQER